VIVLYFDTAVSPAAHPGQRKTAGILLTFRNHGAVVDLPMQFQRARRNFCRQVYRNLTVPKV